MYRSRSDTSSVASVWREVVVWSGLVVLLGGDARRREPGMHQLEQGVVADLGIAAGHRHLVVVEEQHVLGHLAAIRSRGNALTSSAVAASSSRSTMPRPPPGRGASSTPSTRDSFTGGQARGRDLQLRRRHVGPGRLDHLGASPGPVDVAVGAHVTGVAGAEEPVLVEALVRRGPGSRACGSRRTPATHPPRRRRAASPTRDRPLATARRATGHRDRPWPAPAGCRRGGR